MPSLRRTVSESAGSFRSNPYPTGLSLSAAGALNANTPPRSCRSGSLTSGRRVLADIEWWRILDGQQGEENDSGNGIGIENENGNGTEDVQERAVADPQADVVAAPTLEEALEEPSVGAEAAALMPTLDDTAVSQGGAGASQGASSLTTPFAALSILPMTPPRNRLRLRNRNRNRDASDSSSSSAESTPESSPRTPATRATARAHDEARILNLDASDFDDEGLCVPLPSCLGGSRPSMMHSLSMLRAVSFGGFESPKDGNAEDDRFGDVLFL